MHATRRGINAGIITAAGTALVLGAGLVLPAQAAPPDDQTCTRGQAQSVLEAAPSGWAQVQRGQDHAGIARAFNDCSYFLFGDWEGSGSTHTFTDDDVFAGQITWFYPYEAAGVTRREAAAELLPQADRVWLTPVLPDGTLGATVELDVEATPVKSANLSDHGKTVYRTFGVVLDLEPGEYISTWHAVYADEVVQTADVRLIIAP